MGSALFDPLTASHTKLRNRERSTKLMTGYRFCLGTGRPAVLSTNLIRRDQFGALDTSPEDPTDVLIGAELDLYRRLVQLMHFSDMSSTIDDKQKTIEKWREDVDSIYGIGNLTTDRCLN